MDIKNTLGKENVELPSGSIEGDNIELDIRTLGLMTTTEEFNNLIIKENNGRIVRFSDIGRAELSARDLKSYMKMNGVPMVGVVVVPQPGANHINIAEAVYERMEKMKKDLPDDITYSYGFDNTKFIRASINEVKNTVYEAFILVIIIIFLFLFEIIDLNRLNLYLIYRLFLLNLNLHHIQISVCNILRYRLYFHF